MAGVSSEEEFYTKYPSEEDFFKAFPKAKKKYNQNTSNTSKEKAQSGANMTGCMDSVGNQIPCDEMLPNPIQKLTGKIQPIQPNFAPVPSIQNRNTQDVEIGTAVGAKKKKKNVNWANAITTGLMAADYLIPGENINRKYLRPEDTQTYNPNAYGTGSQAIAQMGATLPGFTGNFYGRVNSSKKKNAGDVISQLGYSQGSPFENEPYLNIHSPEGLIDMSNTKKDLLGIDNKGNKKKMKAGTKKPYQFEGDTITEIPIYQNGTRNPIPTNNPNDPRLRAYNDSLKTFNLANLEQKNYYNGKSGVPVPFSKNPQFNSANEFIDSHYGEYTGNSYNRAKELNTVAKRARIKPYGQYTPPPNTGGIGDQYPAYFKKPVQPYFFK